MTEKSLKSAFAVSALLCLCLASALAYVLWRHWTPATSQTDAGPVVARGPETPAQNDGGGKPQATNPEEPALTPIQISPQRMQEIGVTTAVVEMKEVSDELQAPGSVAIDEQRISYVQTRFPGWIRNVFANATYQYVRKGEKLFTIYSPDLVSTEQEYLLAKKNQKAVSEHMHGMPADEGNWLLQAATERLRRFDIPEAEIAQLDSSGTANREITIESPASGYITERNALPNAYIQPETKLYTIADLSTVWVYANVPQTDIGRLKPGDRAQVSVDAYPGRKFNGRIDQILPDVDLTTRTVRVRLVMSNPGVALKPGMYVNVDIAAPLGRQLVIPASGVLQAGSRQIAFIDRGQGSLEPREIGTGPTLGDSIVVLKGLKAGDRIVSSANFLIDSEAQLQSAIGSFAPAPQQAGPGPQQATAQLQIDFITEPNPPRKGTNTVRVRLTSPDGKPVNGVQATVSFFMPAMPAMGMAAQHASASLTEKGNGNYESPIHLDVGGTWQVTISVQRGGSTIATKQFSVSATGGM
ncbi:MAG TPA: FixH family protein [Terracidiphilus sp.]|nr:FixH family protein [Terracidiphilus sp.]